MFESLLLESNGMIIFPLEFWIFFSKVNVLLASDFINLVFMKD